MGPDELDISVLEQTVNLHANMINASCCVSSGTWAEVVSKIVTDEMFQAVMQAVHKCNHYFLPDFS